MMFHSCFVVWAGETILKWFYNPHRSRCSIRHRGVSVVARTVHESFLPLYVDDNSVKTIVSGVSMSSGLHAERTTERGGQKDCAAAI
jgi:hypothetical protein